MLDAFAATGYNKVICVEMLSPQGKGTHNMCFAKRPRVTHLWELSHMNVPPYHPTRKHYLALSTR